MDVNNRSIVVDITEPDFHKFVGCGIRFMRDAFRITFCTLEDWERFQREHASTMMPWVKMDPTLRPAVESSGTVLGVLSNPRAGLVLDPSAQDIKPGLIRIAYSATTFRAFDARVAALRGCGINNDWWEDVVVEVNQ